MIFYNKKITIELHLHYDCIFKIGGLTDKEKNKKKKKEISDMLLNWHSWFFFSDKKCQLLLRYLLHKHFMKFKYVIKQVKSIKKKGGLVDEKEKWSEESCKLQEIWRRPVMAINCLTPATPPNQSTGKFLLGDI